MDYQFVYFGYPKRFIIICAVFRESVHHIWSFILNTDFSFIVVIPPINGNKCYITLTYKNSQNIITEHVVFSVHFLTCSHIPV